jgi:DNA-directed RNA polymerase specialized sigma subunit
LRAASAAEPKKAVDPKKPTHYVRNKDLLPEIIRCREKGEVSNELARMLLLIVKNYSRKSNWASYTFRDDMEGHALVHLSNAALKFNPERSNNPFAYYTQVAKNAFIQIIKQERKQQNAKDSVRVNIGDLPSWGYQEAYKAEIESQRKSREDMEEAQSEYDGFSSEKESPFIDDSKTESKKEE